MLAQHIVTARVWLRLGNFTLCHWAVPEKSDVQLVRKTWDNHYNVNRFSCHGCDARLSASQRNSPEAMLRLGVTSSPA